MSVFADRSNGPVPPSGSFEGGRGGGPGAEYPVATTPRGGISVRPLWPSDLQQIVSQPSIKTLLTRFGVHMIDDLGAMPANRLTQLVSGLDTIKGHSSKQRRGVKELMDRVNAFQRVRFRPASVWRCKLF